MRIIAAKDSDRYRFANFTKAQPLFRLLGTPGTRQGYSRQCPKRVGQHRRLSFRFQVARPEIRVLQRAQDRPPDWRRTVHVASQPLRHIRTSPHSFQ